MLFTTGVTVTGGVVLLLLLLYGGLLLPPFVTVVAGKTGVTVRAAEVAIRKGDPAPTGVTVTAGLVGGFSFDLSRLAAAAAAAAADGVVGVVVAVALLPVFLPLLLLLLPVSWAGRAELGEVPPPAPGTRTTAPLPSDVLTISCFVSEDLVPGPGLVRLIFILSPLLGSAPPGVEWTAIFPLLAVLGVVAVPVGAPVVAAVVGMAAAAADPA